MILTETQIEKAVNWWANVITGPKFDTGDKSPAGTMATMMSALKTTQVTDDKAKDFKVALRAKLSDPKFGRYGPRLVPDYSQEDELREAFNDAQISPSNCPVKTRMYFEADGRVTVCYGYGAPEVEL